MFWMWYTDESPPEPVVFLQTLPDVTIGTGLSLADYVHWNPQPVADEVFTLPEPPCFVPPADAPTPPPACLKCHITSTNTGEWFDSRLFSYNPLRKGEHYAKE